MFQLHDNAARGLALLLGLLILPAALAVPKALQPAGRWLIDEQGRVVILHGVNQVSKLPPYLPSALGFGADDAAYIASQGFNTVRTGWAHAGFAPAPGQYDAEYLADMARTVEELTAQGLYVLFDMHEDMFGLRYQGNGMAEWMNRDSWPGEPSETHPLCMGGFPANLFTCEPMFESFDRFFGLAGRSLATSEREMTLQAEFAEAWQQFALRLRGNRLVFGYNLFNEPHPGSQVLACLTEGVGCPPGADAALEAFDELVAAAIREVDPDTMIFWEPYSTNFNAGFPTSHGALETQGVGFSFHLYACPFAIPGTGVPDLGLSDICGPLREQTVFDNAEDVSEAFGYPALMTEFGASDDLATVKRIADLADANMVGWHYWAWWNEDPCCERPTEGIIDHPSNPPTDEHLKQDKLDVLVRPYPRAVAGTPTAWSWDADTREFRLSYSTAPASSALTAGAVTEIWLPQRHFPAGFELRTLDGAEIAPGAGPQRLWLRNAAGAESVDVVVAALPEEATPPARGGGSALPWWSLLLLLAAWGSRAHRPVHQDRRGARHRG